MHNAPSVCFLVGRSRFQGGLLLGLTLLALAGLAWVVLPRQHGSWGLAVVLCTSVTWVALAWWCHGRQPNVELAFAEGAWSLAGVAHHVRVRHDWGGVMLLRCEPAERVAGVRAQTIWVEADMSPERWSDLRRALYSPTKSHSPHAI